MIAQTVVMSPSSVCHLAILRAYIDHNDNWSWTARTMCGHPINPSTWMSVPRDLAQRSKCETCFKKGE